MKSTWIPSVNGLLVLITMIWSQIIEGFENQTEVFELYSYG